MLEIEDVIKWLTEISLRPCDFATDDFDSYETEHLANEALEICDSAKVFCEQRNDALALLKEQKEQIDTLKENFAHLSAMIAVQPEIVRCKDCVNSGTSRCPCHYSGDPYIDWDPDDDWFCADGERRDET